MQRPPLALLMADGVLTLPARAPRPTRWCWCSVALCTLLSMGTALALAVEPLHSIRELAHALAARRGPHETVLMLSNYYYNVSFYARVAGPVAVVEDWADSGVHRVDNWRKELADTGHFAPAHRCSSSSSYASHTKFRTGSAATKADVVSLQILTICTIVHE